MDRPLGTVNLPVFIRFNGTNYEVGTVEVDIREEVEPQLTSVVVQLSRALEPSEGENTAGPAPVLEKMRGTHPGAEVRTTMQAVEQVLHQLQIDRDHSAYWSTPDRIGWLNSAEAWLLSLQDHLRNRGN